MKTAVITGGSSGIGKAVAAALAKKGFRVIIHGRHAGKTKEAAAEIKAQSGKKEVDYAIADISDVSGMKELAEAIKKKTDSINALVLSAGVILPKRVVTRDGLEMMFAVQYLSRFAATQFLLPLLQKGNAKIVHVGAPVIKGAEIYFDDISFAKGFSMIKAMGQCMFANHLFVQEFARRYPANEMMMNMMFGGIARTGIMRETNFLFRMAVKLAGKKPEKAASNAIHLASDESINFSGYFLNKPADPSVKEKIEHPVFLAEKLWIKSLELIK